MPSEERNTPERKAVWFSAELWQQAAKVGSYEDKTPAEVLEDIVRAPLRRKLKGHVQREHVELGENGA
jgi:hypothetical protein